MKSSCKTKLGVASAIRGGRCSQGSGASGRESPISPGRRGGETLEGSFGRSAQYLVRTWKGGEEHLSWRRKGDILQGGNEGAPGEAGKEANVCKEVESGQSKVALGSETE